MSAEEIRRRSVEIISEQRDRAAQYSLNARFTPSAYASDGRIPATTAEEIALQVIEGNALVRAYTDAIAAINEVYRKMHSPDDDKIPEQVKKENFW
jgi:hypothetical protein